MYTGKCKNKSNHIHDVCNKSNSRGFKVKSAIPNPRCPLLHESYSSTPIMIFPSLAKSWVLFGISTRSRERYKLWIPGPTIYPNIILRKPLLGVNPPRLIKIYSSAFHDILHFPLAMLIEAGARISGGNVRCQVKFIRCETGLNIIREG